MNYIQKDSWNTPHDIAGHMPFKHETDEKKTRKNNMNHLNDGCCLCVFFRLLQCPQVHMLFFSDNICDISFFDESAQN